MLNHSKSSGLPLRLARTIGTLLALLASVVLIGWLTHNRLLVQVLFDAPPMRFNTAFCLLLLGIALCALGREKRRLARCLGAAVSVFAASTLSQELFSINLGIDNLLINDWSNTGPNPGGRMADNTACCFVLSGVGLALLSSLRRRHLQSLLECLCGAIVFAIGSASAFGYLSGLEAMYGWGGSRGMAVHTAVSFTLVGSTLVGLALMHARNQLSNLPRWLPLPISFAVVTGTLIFWQTLLLDARKQTHRATQVRSDKLAALIKGRLTARIEGLERMAGRCATASVPPREHWEADSRNYLKHFRDFQMLAWLVPDSEVSWVVPTDNNSGLRQIAAVRKHALRLASERRNSATTSVVELDELGKVFLICCPVFHGEQLTGSYLATVRVSLLVDELTQEDVESGYRVVIADDSQRVFTSEPVEVSEDGRWSESTVEFDAIRWRIKLCMTPEAAAAQASWLPLGVLCGGLLVAIVLSLAIYFAQRASERSQAAEAAVAELRIAQAKFRAIFDQTFQFIGLLSTEGIVLDANRTALEFAGISAAEVLGKPFWETPWWSHSSELQQQLRAAVAAAASGTFQRFETTHPDRNGQTHYVDFSLKPALDGQGRVSLLIPEGRDVTDHRTAEIALQKSHTDMLNARAASDAMSIELQQRNQELELERTKAEAANHMKTEFLANMSHEIRTPLTAILGFADLLREDCAGALTLRQRNQTIDTIKNAGEHLLTVINDILDLSKIEANKLSIEQINTSFVDLLREVESMMRSRAIGKGLAFNVLLATPVPEQVISDPTRLRQILVNLVGNAVKFTEVGRVTVTASVAQCEPGPRLVIEVDDTGPGMTQEQSELLFAAFGQADASVTRKHGGTGLGLSICRRLARLMGGTVTLARTKPGRGTCFRVELPLEPVSGTNLITQLDAVKETQPDNPAAAAVRLAGRILLAEDGPDNQELISFYLRNAGAEVEIADNGRIALEMLNTAARAGIPYQLLVTDMQMPEMDGYTLATTLRMQGSTLGIIALTAHAMASDRQKCLDAGCDDYAAKPINKKALLKTCGHWLDHGARRSAPAGLPLPSTAQQPQSQSRRAEVLVSELGNDPLSAQLVQHFVSKLPPKVDQIAELLAKNRLDELAQLAHQLKGAGGGYGFPTISEAAARVEHRIKADPDLEQIQLAVAELTQLCNLASSSQGAARPTNNLTVG